MKLELKHLAPYLPYDLQVIVKSVYGKINRAKTTSVTKTLSPILLANVQVYSDSIKPILRPLSDLTKEIEHNGNNVVPVLELLNYSEGDTSKTDFELSDLIMNNPLRFCNGFQLQFLFEWHFDVFGLIDAGLAIDTNTLDV